MKAFIEGLYTEKISFNKNYVIKDAVSSDKNQQQTTDVFSEKWTKFDSEADMEIAERFQLEWYLKLYGFDNEDNLKKFLAGKKVILDAGCGLGYKAAWFAKLSPQSIVLGIDYSDAVTIAAEKYKDIPNLFFVKGDIANTGMKKDSIDYVSCDQVIMHTENPSATFAHLSHILKKDGEFACYVYSKKALPRELLDDYFRSATHKISTKELWDMSSQLTELGKRLSELKITFTAPDIPLLGIKGGEYDIQRFIYWNFLKCFYREGFTEEINNATNFDWYSPSNAKRFSLEEFSKMATDNHLTDVFRHSEEACYTGRFKK
jgi:ubiquinone/menaquinone biosynthesis C-methylase UbiE